MFCVDPETQLIYFRLINGGWFFRPPPIVGHGGVPRIAIFFAQMDRICNQNQGPPASHPTCDLGTPLVTHPTGSAAKREDREREAG